MRLPHDKFVAGTHREWVMVLAGQRLASVRSLEGFLKSIRDGSHGIAPQIARVRALYLISEADGSLRAACSFTLGFDPRGEIPPEFSLPLREMALKSGDGPDLGQGLVRIAHRGKCSIPWHAERLWGDRDADVMPFLDAAQQLLCGRLGAREAVAPERRQETPGRRREDAPKVVALAERQADRAFGSDNTLTPGQLERGRRLVTERDGGQTWSREQVEALKARHRNEIKVLKNEIDLLRRRLRAAELEER